MGKNTFLSLGRPLPTRINIFLSKKSQNLWLNENKYIYVANSLENALKLIETNLAEKVSYTFIRGGATLYNNVWYHKNCKEIFLQSLGISFNWDSIIKKDLLQNFQHIETSKTYSENQIPYDFS